MEGSFYRIRGSNGNRWFPLAKIIQGVFEIFKETILEFKREFQRLNFFFLRN